MEYEFDTKEIYKTDSQKVEYEFDIKGFYKADPQKVGEEIETLGDTFDPADVLELARNPESESHKCFTWDDTKAAEKCRLQEARMLLHHLVIKRVEISKDNDSPKHIFINRRANEYDGSHYGPVTVIVHNPDRYKSLLQECKRELEKIKAKYSDLKEYQAIWNLID